VVGRLLDLQRAVGTTLDHQHTLDLHAPAVLHGLQPLIGTPGRVGVGEVGDDEGVGTIAECSHHIRLINVALLL